MGNCFNPCGDNGHIPKGGFQLVHPVGVKCGHVLTVLGPGGLGGEHGQHVRPIRGLSLDHIAVVAGLQLLQLGVVGDVDRVHGLGHGNGVRGVSLGGKEQTKGRVGNGGDHHDDDQGNQKDAAPGDPYDGAYQCGYCFHDGYAYALDGNGGLFRLCRHLPDCLPLGALSRHPWGGLEQNAPRFGAGRRFLTRERRSAGFHHGGAALPDGGGQAFRGLSGGVLRGLGAGGRRGLVERGVAAPSVVQGECGRWLTGPVRSHGGLYRAGCVWCVWRGSWPPAGGAALFYGGAALPE